MQNWAQAQIKTRENDESHLQKTKNEPTIQTQDPGYLDGYGLESPGQVRCALEISVRSVYCGSILTGPWKSPNALSQV